LLLMTHIRALVPVRVEVGLRGGSATSPARGCPVLKFRGRGSFTYPCLPASPLFLRSLYAPESGAQTPALHLGFFPVNLEANRSGSLARRVSDLAFPGRGHAAPSRLCLRARRLCGENSPQSPAPVLPCLPASFSRLIYFPNKIVIVPLKLFDTTTSSFPSPFKSATANPDHPTSFKLRDEI